MIAATTIYIHQAHASLESSLLVLFSVWRLVVPTARWSVLYKMGQIRLEVNFKVVMLIASTCIEDDDDDNIAQMRVPDCLICGYN
jgi:hypothetical protein